MADAWGSLLLQHPGCCILLHVSMNRSDKLRYVAVQIQHTGYPITWECAFRAVGLMSPTTYVYLGACTVWHIQTNNVECERCIYQWTADLQFTRGLSLSVLGWLVDLCGLQAVLQHLRGHVYESCENITRNIDRSAQCYL